MTHSVHQSKYSPDLDNFLRHLFVVSFAVTIFNILVVYILRKLSHGSGDVITSAA